MPRRSADDRCHCVYQRIVLDLNRDEFVVEAQITTALHHRRYPGTLNIEDETEMSAVWPVEVEEIKEVENMF